MKGLLWNRSQQYNKFKATNTLQDRVSWVKEKREKYTDLFPIIIEKHSSSKLPELQKIKYLVSGTHTLVQIKDLIKNKLQINDRKQVLFIHCGGNLLNEQQTVEDVYNRYVDKEDGFLYLTYSEIEAFG